MFTVETLCSLREIMSLMSFNWIFKESDEEKEDIYDDKLTKEIGREACFGRREDKEFKYFLWAEFVLNIVKPLLILLVTKSEKVQNHQNYFLISLKYYNLMRYVIF